jgi:histone-lysine N-methyltransferase SETD8
LGGIEDGLITVEVEGKGRGVIVARPFWNGDFICEYAGETVSGKEARKREKEYGKDDNIGSYIYYYTYKSTELWYVCSF